MPNLLEVQAALADPRALQLAPPRTQSASRLSTRPRAASIIRLTRTCVRSSKSHWKLLCTCYSITRVSSSAATYAQASASQDIVRVSPPSRVRTGSRTHIPTGTPSRSTICRDTTDTFRTQHRPPAPPADVGDGGAAAEQLARAVMWTASVQAMTANTTIQGT